MKRLLVVLLIALAFESIGVVLLGKGLKLLEPPANMSATEIAALIARGFMNKHIVFGVLCEALFFAGLLYMMSKADVSLVWPLTSLTFVFSTLMARFYLDESISAVRWAGVLLIVCGAGIITYSEKREEEKAGRKLVEDQRGR